MWLGGHRARNNAENTSTGLSAKTALPISSPKLPDCGGRDTQRPPVLSPQSRLPLLPSRSSRDSPGCLLPHTAHWRIKLCVAVSDGQNLSSPDASWKKECFWLLSSLGRTLEEGKLPSHRQGLKSSGQVHTNTSIRTFTATLFVPTNNWRESRCPSAGV